MGVVFALAEMMKQCAPADLSHSRILRTQSRPLIYSKEDILRLVHCTMVPVGQQLEEFPCDIVSVNT